MLSQSLSTHEPRPRSRYPQVAKLVLAVAALLYPSTIVPLAAQPPTDPYGTPLPPPNGPPQSSSYIEVAPGVYEEVSGYYPSLSSDRSPPMGSSPTGNGPGMDDEPVTVIRDIEKLPPQLKEVLDEIPEEHRTRIHNTIRSVGVKIPNRMLGPQTSGIAGGADGVDDEKMKMAAQLLQQFAKIENLERTPSHVLAQRAKLLAEAAKPTPTPGASPDADSQAVTLEELFNGESASSSKDAENLQGHLVAGDWQAVRQQLATLPEPVAQEVYTHLLTLLASNNSAVALPEILALADAAPLPLQEPQLKPLGLLLASSLKRVDEPQYFLERLRQGNRRLGGTEPHNREAAARLLIAAGRPSEAADYLLPIEQVVRSIDIPQLNLYTQLMLFKMKRSADHDSMQLAWDLSQQVLDHEPANTPAFKEALQNSILLLGHLPEETSRPWLQETFANKPELGVLILAGVAHQLGSASNNPGARVVALASLHAAIQALTPVAEAQPERWSFALQLLVLQWANETQRYMENDDSSSRQSRLSGISGDYDFHDYHDSRSNRPSQELGRQLLVSVPSESSLAMIDQDIAWQVRRLSGTLAAQLVAKEPFFKALSSFANHDREVAQLLAEGYLRAWANHLGANSSGEPDFDAYLASNSGSHYGPSYHMRHYYSHEPSIPLTRAKQARKLAMFQELLGEFEHLGVPPLNARMLTHVFASCYSPAEVYRQEDIELIFGPLAKIPGPVALALSESMRRSLAGQWRQLDQQQSQGTQRTDAELAAELDRGYLLLEQLLDTALATGLDQAALLAQLGTVLFDHAEFLYGQEVDLETYVKVRDRAFSYYRRAHEAYAAMPLTSEQYTPELYLQWFRSALGASDLAYLSRQDAPDRDQIDQIASAIRELPGKSADAHLKLFGEALSSNLNEIPSHLKPWCMREALRVLGSHKSGQTFQKTVDFYQELLNEIELCVRVDGTGNIGQQPFGAQVLIRGTTAISREANGFTELLSPGYSYASRESVNHKEKLEKDIRDKLGEGFEIIQICFHEPSVLPRSFGRDGWRETPLAYLLLRAKSEAIDRIPSLQLDLEFADGHGYVQLPIHSAVELVDARSEPPAINELAKLKIKQTFDDRQVAQGSLRLDIKASSNELIPRLQQLISLADQTPASIDGFAVMNVIDHGLRVETLDVSEAVVRPACERRWTLELALPQDVVSKEFHFPQALMPAEASFARFEGADLVDAESVVPLSHWPLTTRSWLSPLLMAAGLAVALAAVVIAVRILKARRTHAASGVSYHRPTHVNPFTVVALLKRLRADASLAWSSADQTALTEAIDQIESHYFSRHEQTANASQNGHTDLDNLLGHWLAKTPG